MCQNCGAQTSSEGRLEELSKEIESLKFDFGTRIVEIEEEITALTKNSDLVKSDSRNDLEKPSVDLKDGNLPANEPLMSNDSPSRHWVFKSRKALIEIVQVAGEILSPLLRFTRYFVEVFKFYRKQKNLPAFFLTSGGIVFLLLAFIYVFQYIPSDYSETIKIIGSVTFSVSTMILATWLIKKDSKYDDFGSALLGLANALNYLIIFFLSGSTVFLIPDHISFILIVLNTILSSWLAFKFETKVVAVVSLLGGAFSPFYLISDFVSLPYFVYLWLLCVASIYISFRIKWEILGVLALLSYSAVIGVALTQHILAIEYSTFLAIFHSFHFLFFHHSLFNGTIHKKSLSKEAALLLTGNVMVFISGMIFLGIHHESYTTLGSFFFFNATVFLIGFIAMNKRLSNRMRVLYMTLIALFTGICISIILEQDMIGIIWSLEGIALIFCGYLFSLRTVRIEGYGAVGIGIFQIAQTFDQIQVTNVGKSFWNMGFVNLLMLAIVIIVLKILIDKFRAGSVRYERILSYIFFELFSGVFLVAILIIGFFYANELTYNLAIILVFILTWWGVRFKLPYTEAAGLFLYFLIVLGVINSMIATESFSFQEQTFLGKMAMVEALAVLFLLHYFYVKVLPTSRMLFVIQILRVVFFLLLPVAALPSVYINYREYFVMALWFGVLLNFLLAELIRKKVLVIEIYVLVAVASAWLFTSINYQNLGVSLAVLSFIYIYKRAYAVHVSKTSSLRFLFSYILYYWGFTLSYMYYVNISPDLWPTVCYLTTIVFFRKYFQPIRNNYKFAYNLSIAFLILTLLQFYWDHILLSTEMSPTMSWRILFLAPVAVLLYHLIIYSKSVYFLRNSNGFNRYLNLYLLNCLNIFIYTGYIGIFLQNWSGLVLTIIYSIHGVILLFNSLNPRFRHLIFFSIGLFTIVVVKLLISDLNNFSVFEKIIATMGVGILLLVSAYIYTRFKHKLLNGSNHELS